MFKKIFRMIIRKIVLSQLNRQFVTDLFIETYDDIVLKRFHVWGEASRLTIGKNVQLNNATINTVSGNVTIGDYTFLGHNVSLLTGTHNYKKIGFERQLDVPPCGRDIVIEEGVWLASNVTVLAPCHIGANTVVAANSVVSGDIDKNSIYAGAHAKKIKDITFTG